ncbi:alpha/beta hydrolase [Actinoallomurus vinaceus]|uniref:Alpha/beta hydrolase n=1 Tax=Actinoallomurus vinaceus TaxID=1080074 RepID=A0ABP8UTI8_9ACTN
MRLRRFACLVTGAAVALSLGTAPPAGATAVPDDQPLPPYTISNPALAPLTVGGRPTTVRQGVFHHAAYDIEVPPNWNGELVMWAHGYRGQTTTLTVDPPNFGLREKLVGEGYAWAASSYADNGYDVRTGVVGTRDLADLFGRLEHRPKRTYITGVSMGGHVIGRSIEQYPHFYSGALPMCGVLGDNRLFDFFLDYNLVAQDLAGVRAYPPPADYLTNAVPRIQQALGLGGLKPGGPDTTNDRGKQLREIVVNRSGGPRPGAEAAFPLWKDFLFSLGAPATGTGLAQNPSQVATNAGTRYTPNAPVDVNATVQRVRPADPADRHSARLSEIPRIFGLPTAKVVTLHGLGDMFVPFSMEEIYGSEVARTHRSGLVVQRAIRTAQHCEFSPAEAGQAWDDLARWVHGGPRPAGDPVTDPAQVARPDFGCRFTDPTGAPAGTRALFPACPKS